MLHFVANGLVVVGIILQFLALRPVRRLITLLPPGRPRFSWYVLTSLIFIFIIGYGAYIPAFWGSHEKLADLVVPAVFFLGACFVLVVNLLSLETARDVRYMAVLERERPLSSWNSSVPWLPNTKGIPCLLAWVNVLVKVQVCIAKCSNQAL